MAAIQMYKVGTRKSNVACFPSITDVSNAIISLLFTWSLLLPVPPRNLFIVGLCVCVFVQGGFVLMSCIGTICQLPHGFQGLQWQLPQLCVFNIPCLSLVKAQQFVPRLHMAARHHIGFCHNDEHILLSNNNRLSEKLRLCSHLLCSRTLSFCLISLFLHKLNVYRREHFLIKTGLLRLE